MDSEGSWLHSQRARHLSLSWYEYKTTWSEGLIFPDTANTANLEAEHVLRNVSGLSLEKRGINKPKISFYEKHSSNLGCYSNNYTDWATRFTSETVAKL